MPLGVPVATRADESEIEQHHSRFVLWVIRRAFPLMTLQHFSGLIRQHFKELLCALRPQLRGRRRRREHEAPDALRAARSDPVHSEHAPHECPMRSMLSAMSKCVSKFSSSTVQKLTGFPGRCVHLPPPI
jgi:hypothetical protein